jgi:hypothetical protein
MAHEGGLMADNTPYVFESDYVGVLMDVGLEVLDLDRETQELASDSTARFADGRHDFPYSTAEWDWDAEAARLMGSDPDAWSSLTGASLARVRGSKNDRELKDRLLHMAAVVVAWATDVDKRTPVGIEPDRG